MTLGAVLDRLRWAIADYRQYTLGGGAINLDGDGVRFHFVAEGSIRSPVDLRAGDFLLLPRGGAHTVVSGPGTVLHTGRFSVTSPEGVAVVAAMPAMVVACRITTKEPMVATLIDGMAAEASGDRPGACSVISHLAGAVAMAAIRSWVESGCGSTQRLSASLRDSDVSRALSAIHGEPGTQWTVDRLARVALASRSAFAKRFRDAVGEPPAKYLARVRMEHAKHLLGERTTVAEVALRLGYGSEAAFSRAFRRHAGVPPTQWRHAGALTPSGR
jgi:AraC-like DNA-binding protein